MELKSKYRLGQKITCEVDGRKVPGVIKVVQVREAVDVHVVTYEVLATIPYPPEIAQKIERKSDTQVLIVGENALSGTN